MLMFIPAVCCSTGFTSYSNYVVSVKPLKPHSLVKTNNVAAAAFSLQLFALSFFSVNKIVYMKKKVPCFLFGRSDTAILYNDRSVLESHHVSAAYRLLQDDDEMNILYNLSKDDWRSVRQSPDTQQRAGAVGGSEWNTGRRKDLSDSQEKWKAGDVIAAAGHGGVAEVADWIQACPADKRACRSAAQRPNWPLLVFLRLTRLR